MPTDLEELEIIDDDVGPVRVTGAEDSTAGRRASAEVPCTGRSAPDGGASRDQQVPDGRTARRASDGNARRSSSDSSSSCGCSSCDGRHSSGCSADAEDSDQPGDSAIARFMVSLRLWRRPTGGVEPRLRLTLRDDDGSATRSVRLEGLDGDEICVQIPDQDGAPLGDIATIDLNCRFDDDLDQPVEGPAVAGHESGPPGCGADVSPEARLLQGDMSRLNLRPTRAGGGGPVRGLVLRGSAGGQQRLYRRGNPERRRVPPPFADRLAARRRRLGPLRSRQRRPAVFISMVTVEDRRRGSRLLFPVTRWLSSRLYRLSPLDSSLPQDVADPTQVTLRQAELLHKRDAYIYQSQRRNNSKLVDMPEEEKFPDMNKLFVDTRQAVQEECASLGSEPDEWGSFAEMEKAFKPMLLGSDDPDVAGMWHTDRWFGAQRVMGLDPSLITLCTAIPAKLGVTESMLRPFFEKLSLSEVIRRKRLFLVDLDILDGLETIEGTELCAPVALFFLNSEDDLVPVAIQLHQRKGAANPVFLPSDPVCLWMLAKMFYNCAEAQHHQLGTLAISYLLLESVAISVHRCLSPSHPVFRLLAPHLHRQLAAAELARRELLAPGGFLERCGQLSNRGRQQLVSRRLGSWRLDTCGVIPRQVAGRGVASPEVLPYYPYRDDATALYTALESYVRACLQSVYGDDSRLARDWELLQWRRELTLSAADGGLGLCGVPGGIHKGFSNLEQLVEVVTAVIATGTVGRSAASRHQRAHYGLPANYPLRLRDRPPRSKDRIPSVSDLLRPLPGRRATLEVSAVTGMLSDMLQPCFPCPEVQYLWDPVSTKAAEDLKKETRLVASRRAWDNLRSEFPYKNMMCESLSTSVRSGVRPRPAQ